MGRPKININACISCVRNKSVTKQLCSTCYRRAYYADNRDKENLSRQRYNKANPEKMAKRKREREKRDPNYRLANRLRSRLCHSIKGGGSIDHLGCSIEEFKYYLESKFEVNMSWNNHTNYGWHIDHIIPLSSVDLTNEDDLKKVCHYSNLRPLWWDKNLGRRYGKEK